MFGPSPVHPLKRLSAHLAGASIGAKREDCNAGLAFGGNKVRKLECLVPDARAKAAKADALPTCRCLRILAPRRPSLD